MMFQLSFMLYLSFIFDKLHSSFSQLVQPGLCDTRCHCPPGEAVVDCNRQDRLQGVPTNIPLGVLKLYIQDGDFPSPSYLTRANMTGLEQIEYLSIIYCNLQAIDSKTFLGMTRLKQLDLSRNAIRRLDMYTFFGLQLVNLYLQEQHNLTESGLYIASDAFDGLTAEQINLRGNQLTSLRFSIFSRVNNLHRLILSDNRITQLDEEFSKHFNGQSYLLDLTGNPLECNCRLAWIAAWSADWAKSLPGLNMTCVYIPNLPGPDEKRKQVVLELHRLTAEHLCPRSRIQHIEVSISDLARRAILECTAIAAPRIAYPKNTISGSLFTSDLLNRAPPEVAWQYVEGGHLREVRRLPIENVLFTGSSVKDNNSGLNNASSTVRLNISISDDPRQYKCITRNELMDPEEVVITLRGPSKIALLNNAGKISEDFVHTKYAKSVDRIGIKSELQQTDLDLTEPHYLLHPQFSLMQMALAVVGTFLITAILLLFGARCFTRCHSPNLLRLSSVASSIDTSDAKVVYQSGTVTHVGGKTVDKAYNPTKQNGSQTIPKCSSQVAMHHTRNTHNWPQVLLSRIDGPVPMSPQFTHLANLPNPYFQCAMLTNTQPSSNSEADDLHTSLAHLVSTPLLPTSSTLRANLTPEGALSPYPQKNRAGQQTQVTYWPSVTSGSPYSVAGSHEYDIPRILEMPPYSMVISSSTPKHFEASNQTDMCNSISHLS
ncbi:unnamed protein product [Dicrocoelium dendriticum]|nr:unnamed protein product [Dicrocoelium dendriticum]